MTLHSILGATQFLGMTLHSILGMTLHSILGMTLHSILGMTLHSILGNNFEKKKKCQNFRQQI